MVGSGVVSPWWSSIPGGGGSVCQEPDPSRGHVPAQALSLCLSINYWGQDGSGDSWASEWPSMEGLGGSRPHTHTCVCVCLSVY